MREVTIKFKFKEENEMEFSFALDEWIAENSDLFTYEVVRK